MSTKVVIVYYARWPGMGVKAVVSGDEQAAEAIELLSRHRRLANLDRPLAREGFVLIDADLDVLEIAGRRYELAKKTAPPG